MKKIAIALATATALLAAPAVSAKPKLTGEQKLAKILKGREAGEPVSCIDLNRARNTRIIDKTAIVYDAGSVIYVNRPANAKHLDDDDILVTRLHSNRLCNVDIVHTKDRTMFFPTGFVSLEKFVPYRKIAKAD
jgi:hypothetical protein